jgi:dihydrofolate synthase/folylpolyglutamate synthase
MGNLKSEPNEGKPYRESLDYLYSLQKFGMIFGLEKVEGILKAIGNPHEALSTIHVGGTNGKGSTAAMMASILEKEGYRVGLYTSPHLVRFTERIQVNGEEIAEEEVASLTDWMRERIEAAGVSPPFTFFDFTTAMALSYFNQKVVDLAILEVGLGGRLDSTNVVTPLLSMVTNISRDHEDVLGRGILRIAREKAGIIKEGRPFITAATQPRVLRLFSDRCRELGAPFYRVGKEFQYRTVGPGRLDYEGRHWKLWNIELGLRGSYQMRNAATALGAIEVLEELGYRISVEAIMEGLRTVRWPARLETISSAPKVVVDGAHNPAGVESLREALKEGPPYRRLILLVGIMKDKPFQSMLRTLSPLADHIILSRPSIERAAAPHRLWKAMGENRGKAEVVEDLREAIERGLSMTEEGDLFCITGSLYTAGEALSYFESRRGS